MSNLQMVMNAMIKETIIHMDDIVMEGLKIPGTEFDLTVHEIGTSKEYNNQEEGNYPHIHVNTKNIQPYTCIRLDTCDYFLHKDYHYTIDQQGGGKTVKKKINKFLNDPYTGKDRDVQGMDLTNWGYLVFKWNRGGSYIKVPELYSATGL